MQNSAGFVDPADKSSPVVLPGDRHRGDDRFGGDVEYSSGLCDPPYMGAQTSGKGQNSLPRSLDMWGA